MRVVDGADPYKIKTRVKPITKIKNTISIPSAQVPNPRPPCTFSGRADNACTNLLGYLVRYVRTRGIDEAVESGKTTDFCFILCRTHSPRILYATNSCTPHGGSEGGRRESSLLTFAALLVTQKRDKRKVSSCFFAGEHCSTPVSATPTHTLRVCVNSPT